MSATSESEPRITNHEPRKHSARIAAFLILALGIITGCGGGGGGGGEGGGGTAPPPDTTPPAVTVSEPTEGTSYTLNVSSPSRISLSYADGSGVNIGTLSVTFTLNQRTIDLTGLFTKTASSASAESVDIYSLAAVSAYSGAGFSSFTSATVAIPGNPAQCDFRPDATADKLFLFCPSDASSTFRKITVISGSTGAAAEVTTAFPVKAFAAAPAAGKYYAARADANGIIVYSAASNNMQREISLNAAPKDISYNAQENRLYVSYSTAGWTNRVDYVDCATDQIAGGYTPADAFSEMRAAFSGAGFLLMAQKQGQFWFQTYNGAGASVLDVALMQLLPGDIEWLAAASTDFHYFSDTTNNRLILYDSAQAATSTTALAFKPEGLFADRGGSSAVLYAISSDGGAVRNMGSGTDYSLPAPVVNGEAMGGKKYLLENIWQIDTQVTGTLTATVKDGAGNTGTKTITLKFAPESQGIRRGE